jgi:hypothetical protein
LGSATLFESLALRVPHWRGQIHRLIELRDLATVVIFAILPTPSTIRGLLEVGDVEAP